MGNLTKVRQKFMLVLAVLGVVDLLLIIYLLLPGSSPSGKAGPGTEFAGAGEDARPAKWRRCRGLTRSWRKPAWM